MDQSNKLRLAVLSAILSAGNGALADEAPPQTDSAALEEVIVTAQKRAQSLQDVPIALSAMSYRQIEDSRISDLQDIQFAIPGLTFQNTALGAQPFLRGIGTRLAQPGLESSIAIYVDDRYIARNTASLLEFTGIERIEVLKGPQGTLYGRNATGGAIRIVTRSVTSDFGGEVSGSFGNYSRRNFSGTVNIPVTESFGARISALLKNRDGYRTNIDPRGRKEWDDQDFAAYHLKTDWRIADNVSSVLSVMYTSQQDAKGLHGVDISAPFGLNAGIAAGGVNGDRDHVASAVPGGIDLEDISGQLRFDVALSGVDLVSITTFSNHDQSQIADADGVSAVFIDVPQGITESDAWSQEFQLVSQNEGNLEWVVGANYFKEKAKVENLLNLADRGLVGLRSQGNGIANTDAWAIFGQGTYQFNESWALTLGGRYSYEEKNAAIQPTTRGVASLAPFPFYDEDDWAEFTPKATMTYNLSHGMIYATYARGFKSGGFNYAYSMASSKTLDPEILDMYELGWKTDLLGGALRFNGAIYYYDNKDLQVTRTVTGPDGNNIITTENAANAEVLGLDLETSWLVTDGFRMDLGLNVLDTEYKDFRTTAQMFNTVLTGNPVAGGMTQIAYDASGKKMLRTPDWSAHIAATKEFSIGNSQFALSANYSYKDDFNFDFIAHPSTGKLQQEAFGLLSAQLSYVPANIDALKISIWGKNLTDEVEYFSEIVATAIGMRAAYGAPRTYGVDVSYAF